MSNQTERNRLWKEKFHELCAFKEAHGHLKVPRRNKDGKTNKLYVWTQSQRNNDRKKKLEDDRREKLKDIGFAFVTNRKDEAWDEMFGQLSHFKAKNGTFVISSADPAWKTLYKWVDTQRCAQRKGDLTPVRQDKLNSIGFPWTPPTNDIKWEAKFRELRQYKEVNGNLDAPKRDPQYADLYSWIIGQRQQYKKKKLSASRIDRLSTLGFSFESNQSSRFDQTWEMMFMELMEYHQEQKHFSIPSGDATRRLHRWAHTQRELFRKNELSEDRVGKLDSIGFDWSSSSKATVDWEENFKRLQSFKAEHGHCLVPKKHTDAKLVAFVRNCRRQEGEGRLGAGEKARLNEIGFVFDAKAETTAKTWELRYQELKKYHEKVGSYESLNQNSAHNTPYAGLAKWVSDQRMRKSQTSTVRAFAPLSQGQIEKLEAIHFDWRPSEKRDERWNNKLQRLKKYKQKHGDCMVPKNYEEDRQLGTWLAKQRHEFRLGKLKPERKEKLEAVGVVWNPGRPWGPDYDKSHLDAWWLLKYEQLCLFKEEFGHCLVSRLDSRYEELGVWVEEQRKTLKEKRMDGERKRQLDEVGFVWETDTSDPQKSIRMKEWDSMYERLAEFRKKHGHCRTPYPYFPGVEDNQLSIWVATQRKWNRSGQLSTEKRSLLEAIDFIWEPKEED